MRQLRIFVSSPGDCEKERALLDEAVERINLSELDRTGVFLRTFAWEKDVVPRIGPPAQSVVDEQTPLCDIYVGIMSARFGGDGTRESGTESELRDALQRFGDTGQPWIVFYFNEQPDVPRTSKGAREWTRVIEFKEELEAKGIVGSYSGARGNPNGFFETIELHLRQLIQRPEFADPPLDLRKPAGGGGQRPGTSRPAIPPKYLAWLQSKCAGVDLFGLEPKYGSAARLQSIYVPLITKPRPESLEPARGTARDEGGIGSRPEQPAVLLDRLAEESLYVPGSPGSGKSTFCRWVTWLVCEGRLPPTNFGASPAQFREEWPRTFADRLPVLVRLREYWQSLPVKPRSRELSGRDFADYLANWVGESSGTIDPETVAAHFAAGTALIVLDGVDEVPISHGEDKARWFPRALLVSGLANAMPWWTGAGNRVLVTSRPYGLTTGDVSSLAIPEAPLLDLEEALQQLLIERWFQQLRPGQEGTEYAAALKEHLRANTWLEPLAVNPLLLTGMCIVFDEGGRLPQDKHDLYVRIVNTVLNSRYRDDTRQRDAARYRLQAIAYGMHTGHSLGAPRATPEAVATHRDVDRILRDYLDKSASKEAGNVSVVAVREDLLADSGLFLNHGPDRAGFYHFSFQEFLAGQRLADVEDDLLPVFVERGNVPEWRNTLSLLFASLTREKAARLLTGIVSAFGTSGPYVQDVAADCLHILLARGVRLAASTESKCRDAFLQTMRSEAPAVVRCRVGSMLGRLGDPRFHDERLLHLPADPMLGFAEIPAGDFVMGRDLNGDDQFRRDPHEIDGPAHRVTLPTYLIARYLTTAAQFAGFVAARGHKVEDSQLLRGIANHPVIGVTWFDANAYCHWLDEWLRSSPQVPAALASRLATLKNWRVALPSEAEWERAGRGRLGRRYPWAEPSDLDRTNTREASIGTTSPVGAFGRGATPAADGSIEDLLGNVWEWTRGGPTPYPYVSEQQYIFGDAETAVARGGANHLPLTEYDMMSRVSVIKTISRGIIGFRVTISTQHASHSAEPQSEALRDERTRSE